MAKKKQVKKTDTEPVKISTAIVNELRERKKTTGQNIRYQVENAIKNDLIK